jgi:uncharacterized membrane protein YdbT with pleckstrin-like domain
MSYVETILDPDERITYRAYLHWIIFLRGIVLWLLGLMFVAAALAARSEGGGTTIGFILVVLGVVAVLKAAIDRWTTEIAVTNQRVILKRGLIRRDTIEINMPKVESVDVQQSVLGRLLNYGTVIVRGTGGSLNPLAYVSEPLPLRRAVTLAAKSAPAFSLISAHPGNVGLKQ